MDKHLTTTLMGGLAVCLLALGTALPGAAQSWQITRLVNDTGQSVGMPCVKAFGDSFTIAYPIGSAGSSAVDYRIYAAQSADGFTWNEPLAVRDVPGNNPFCDLAFLSNGMSVVSWHRKRPDGEAYDIWLATELDAGYWETERVTDDLNDDKRSNVAVLSDDSVVIVFPRQIPPGSGGDKDIALARLNGDAWEIEALTDNAQGDHRPVVAVDENDVVHVLYPGYIGNQSGSPIQPDWNLFYTNNANGSWSERVNLTETLGLPNKSDWPSAAFGSDGVLHVLCAAGASESGEDREIYHLALENGQWTQERISECDAPCEWCSLAVGRDGSLYAAYQVGRVFNQTGSVPTEIYYSERKPNAAWSAPEAIADSWNDSERPAIAVNDAGVVTVAYWAKIGGANQLIAASSDRSLPPSLIPAWEVFE